MKPIRLTRTKTKRQPKTLRTLSADECRVVSGGSLSDPGANLQGRTPMRGNESPSIDVETMKLKRMIG